MREIPLYKTKWYDNRLITPDEATLKFVRDFSREQDIYHESLGESKFMNTLKWLDFKDESYKQTKQFKSFKNFRQKVDRLGLKYDLFWAKAFELVGEWNIKPILVEKGNLSYFYMPISKFLNDAIFSAIVQKYKQHPFKVKADHAFFYEEKNASNSIFQEYQKYLKTGVISQ